MLSIGRSLCSLYHNIFRCLPNHSARCVTAYSGVIPYVKNVDALENYLNPHPPTHFLLFYNSQSSHLFLYNKSNPFQTFTDIYIYPWCFYPTSIITLWSIFLWTYFQSFSSITPRLSWGYTSTWSDPSGWMVTAAVSVR